MAFRDKRTNDMDSSMRLAFSRQGAPTSPQTPNQIAEMGRLLNSGMKNVEVGALQLETFETIPTQHFSEIRRLAKITDSKVSVHAPLIDPAGFSQQGWSEQNREENERYIKTVLEKAHEINPDGNIPVNMHTTIGVPGNIPVVEKGGPKLWDESSEEYKKLRKAGIPIRPGQEMMDVMTVVDQEKGQMIQLKREELMHMDETRYWTPEERIRMQNKSAWDNEKLQLLSLQREKARTENAINEIRRDPKWLELNIAAKDGRLDKDHERELNNMNTQILLGQERIQEYDIQLSSGLNALHHKYVKFKGKPQSEAEKREYENAEKHLNETKKIFNAFHEQYEKLKKSNSSPEEKEKRYHELNKEGSKVYDSVLLNLSQLPPPEYFISAEEFAKRKSVETFSNAAAHAYKKYGDKAPMLVLENFMPTTVLSRADSMKQLIKETREATAKVISKDKGIDEKKALKIAEKIIGATWDVGHLHQLKKQGWSEKELLKETERIAPYVKHVHLTDNFGHSDAHLPLGMGDVPIKEHLKRLEAAADKDRVNIVESGAYPAHFKQSPLPQTLDYFDSPVYSYEAGPYWQDARDMYASYLVGYGDILPEKHFDTFFGAGFSRLPKELGGQSQGNRSRFTGTPNQ